MSYEDEQQNILTVAKLNEHAINRQFKEKPNQIGL